MLKAEKILMIKKMIMIVILYSLLIF